MADTAALTETPPKRARWPLLLGGLLALLLGAGGFYATFSGMILSPAADAQAEGESVEEPAGPLPDIAFVPVDPVVITLGPGAQNKHLRFTAQLEVAKPTAAEVTLLMPRILDVLNSYLRAVEVAQLEDPAALLRLRAQMLRRVQIVTGEGRVRDLLITEFVLN